MDYIVRKVLTETQYAATKETLDPYEGVVVVSDGDPTQVVTLAIGNVTLAVAGGGAAPADATYITNTDESATLANSINIGATNSNVGSQSILMNNPLVFNEGNVVALELTTNNTGLMFVNNAGTLSQTASLDFTKTSGRQDVTFGGVGTFFVDATAYALNGNFVGSDYGFDGNVFKMNIIESNTTDIVFRRQLPGTPLKVTWQSNVEADFQGAVYTNFTSSTGTPVVVGAANQLFLQTSSRRFKENIQPLESSSEQLENILKLNPVTYTYKNGSSLEQNEDASEIRPSIGLIAEDVFELIPELVNLDQTGQPFSLDYGAVGVLLINAIKELNARIQVLEQKLNA
jgi:hypothetical protein